MTAREFLALVLVALLLAGGCWLDGRWADEDAAYRVQEALVVELMVTERAIAGTRREIRRADSAFRASCYEAGFPDLRHCRRMAAVLQRARRP